MIKKACKNCGDEFNQYNTTQTLCARCSYEKYQNQSRRPRKAIRKVSKKTEQKEIDAKYAWFDANPPDENGHWFCYLMIHPLCPYVLDRSTITQEHVKPKQRYPELKYDITNRKPSCSPCNALKSGRSLESLAKLYPHLQNVVDNI